MSSRDSSDDSSSNGRVCVRSASASGPGSSGGGKPQYYFIIDCTKSARNNPLVDVPDEYVRSAKLHYVRLTGQRAPREPSRLLIIIVLLYDIAESVARGDLDGVVHVMFMGTDDEATIEHGADVHAQLDGIAKRMLTAPTRGSDLLPDLGKCVDLYLADETKQSAVVIVLTDGSFSDIPDLERYMAAKVPEIVRHAPRKPDGCFDDTHFGVAIILATSLDRVPRKIDGVKFIDGPYRVDGHDVDICGIMPIHRALGAPLEDIVRLAQEA